MGVSVISLLPSTRGPALPIRARQRSSRPGQLFGLCRRKGRDDPRYSTVSEQSLDHGAVGLSRPHSRFYGHAQHTRGKKKQLSWMSRGKVLRRSPGNTVFEDGVEDREQLAHAQATNATFFGLPAAKRRS